MFKEEDVMKRGGETERTQEGSSETKEKEKKKKKDRAPRKMRLAANFSGNLEQ